MKLIPMAGGDGQDHALLSFADPDFSIGEPAVLERSLFEPNLRTGFFTHLADRAAEPARSALGDGVKQPSVAGFENDIEQHLFGDGVADLHCTAGEFLALMRQLDRRERGAVNTVTACSSSDSDDEVARHYMLFALPAGNHGDVAAVD